MITTQVAADEIRRQMEISLGLREPVRRRRPTRRAAVRVAAAIALRGLADRLEPTPETAVGARPS